MKIKKHISNNEVCWLEFVDADGNEHEIKADLAEMRGWIEAMDKAANYSGL